MTPVALPPLLLILLMVTLPAEAQVYKWIDANGHTQYGDMPPHSGTVKAETIRAMPPQPSSEQAFDWEQKDRDFRRRKIERDAMKPAEEPGPASQQICASARHKIKTLDGRLIYRLDKNGERVYMEEDERAAIEKNARQDIANHCPH